MSSLYAACGLSRIFNKIIPSGEYVYTNYRLIVSSSCLEQSISDTLICPAHMTYSKDAEDTWSDNCHVDRETWNNAKPFSEMPGLNDIPIVGNNWRFLPGGEYYNMQLTDIIEKFHTQFGKIVKVEGILGRPNGSVLVDCAEDVEMVYKQESANPVRDLLGSIEYFRTNYRQDIFKNAKGLISTNGHDWYTFRQKVNKIMMQPKVIKQYVSPIDAVAKDFVQSIKKIRKLDGSVGIKFNKEIKKWSLESIAFPALDRRLGCFDDDLPIDSMPNRFITNTEQAIESLEKLDHRPNLWKYIPTPTFMKAMKIYDEQISITSQEINKSMKIIKAKRAAGQIKKYQEKSILEKLMEIDPNVAVVMVSDMFFAAIDTTSNVLNNTLYNLGVNKAAQQKLRDEINSVIPCEVHDINIDHLSNMPYLKACIKEAARLFPPIPATIRILTKDTVLSGYQVPKGITVLLCHMTLSVKEEYFPRPKEFVPERWLRENRELSHKKAHRFATMPFGFGPRSCVGRRLADLELEVVLTNFIRSFDITWDGEAPTKSQMSNVNCFKGPSNLIFKDIQ